MALVPTMGALHDGHMSLVRLAKRRAARVVVSIFVNPAQFAPAEDFSTYLRPFAADVAALAEEKVDLAWAPAHVATYLAVALAGFTALALVANRTPAARVGGVRFGKFYAPLGAWLAAWGALAFPVTVLFDRWWQSAYGLTAGIWHPPQILKAVAFFAVVIAVRVWLRR